MELETPVVPVPHPRGPLGLQTRESAGGQAVKKRRKYRVWDLGGEEIIHARNTQEAAEKFAEGFFNDPPDPEKGTCFAEVNVQEIEDEDDPYDELFVNTVYIPIDPPLNLSASTSPDTGGRRPTRWWVDSRKTPGFSATEAARSSTGSAPDAACTASLTRGPTGSRITTETNRAPARSGTRLLMSDPWNGCRAGGPDGGRNP